MASVRWRDLQEPRYEVSSFSSWFSFYFLYVFPPSFLSPFFSLEFNFTFCLLSSSILIDYAKKCSNWLFAWVSEAFIFFNFIQTQYNCKWLLFCREMTSKAVATDIKNALKEGLEKHFEILYYRKDGECLLFIIWFNCNMFINAGKLCYFP